MRLSLEILHRSGGEENELRAVGGVGNAAARIQLKAGVLGQPVTVPRFV